MAPLSPILFPLRSSFDMCECGFYLKNSTNTLHPSSPR